MPLIAIVVLSFILFSPVFYFLLSLSSLSKLMLEIIKDNKKESKIVIKIKRASIMLKVSTISIF